MIYKRQYASSLSKWHALTLNFTFCSAFSPKGWWKPYIPLERDLRQMSHFSVYLCLWKPFLSRFWRKKQNSYCKTPSEFSRWEFNCKQTETVKSVLIHFCGQTFLFPRVPSENTPASGTEVQDNPECSGPRRIIVMCKSNFWNLLLVSGNGSSDPLVKQIQQTYHWNKRKENSSSPRSHARHTLWVTC